MKHDQETTAGGNKGGGGGGNAPISRPTKTGRRGRKKKTNPNKPKRRPMSAGTVRRRRQQGNNGGGGPSSSKLMSRRDIVNTRWLENELSQIDLYWSNQPRTKSMYHGQPPPPSDAGSEAGEGGRLGSSPKHVSFFHRNRPVSAHAKLNNNNNNSSPTTHANAGANQAGKAAIGAGEFMLSPKQQRTKKKERGWKTTYAAGSHDAAGRRVPLWESIELEPRAIVSARNRKVYIYSF